MHPGSIDIVRLRLAHRSDILQMRSLEEQADGASHWSATQYESLFESKTQDRVLLVAADDTDDAAIYGFIVARCLTDEWEIENVVVSADYRRQGIARSLVRAVADAAIAAKAGSVILEVRASNIPAVRLYESIGFIEEGRRKDYYRNPSEDAFLFRRTLHFCDKIS